MARSVSGPSWGPVRHPQLGMGRPGGGTHISDHLIKLSDQVIIWSSYHLIKLSSDQVIIWTSYHLIKLSSDQVIIWSCYHLIIWSWTHRQAQWGTGRPDRAVQAPPGLPCVLSCPSCLGPPAHSTVITCHLASLTSVPGGPGAPVSPLRPGMPSTPGRPSLPGPPFTPGIPGTPCTYKYQSLGDHF